MGKVILCTGEQALKPYFFASSNIGIYTIEELCYYIYNNIESVAEDLYKEELVNFIKEELHMYERAAFINDVRKKNAGLKDIVVSILCSADYYTEKEIKDLLAEIDVLLNLKPIQRKKRSADLYMKDREYKDAYKEYMRILNSKELAILTQEECGDVMHNTAFIHAMLGEFSIAAEGFREAYERNHNKESVKQYLYALKLSGQNTLYESELENYVRIGSVIQEIKAGISVIDEQWKESNEYVMYHDILRLKEQGRVQEYDEEIEELLNQFKDEYRSKCI